MTHVRVPQWLLGASLPVDLEPARASSPASKKEPFYIMSQSDVRLARARGWGPGTLLVMTENRAEHSPDGTTATDDCNIVFQITRLEGARVFGRLLYEMGRAVQAQSDQPLTIDGVPWRELSANALEQLLPDARVGDA